MWDCQTRTLKLTRVFHARHSSHARGKEESTLLDRTKVFLTTILEFKNL